MHTEPTNEELGITPYTGWRLLAGWIVTWLAGAACLWAAWYVFGTVLPGMFE